MQLQTEFHSFSKIAFMPMISPRILADLDLIKKKIGVYIPRHRGFTGSDIKMISDVVQVLNTGRIVKNYDTFVGTTSPKDARSIIKLFEANPRQYHFKIANVQPIFNIADKEISLGAATINLYEVELVEPIDLLIEKLANDDVVEIRLYSPTKRKYVIEFDEWFDPKNIHRLPEHKPDDIPLEDEFFWTDEWLAGEREAEQDMREGNYVEYTDIEDFIKDFGLEEE